jgi:hypothetical protein
LLGRKGLKRRLSRLWWDRLRGGNGQENTQYGAHRAPERAPFEGRAEGKSPHPSLKEQSEGRGAYSVLGSDLWKWYVFSRLTSVRLYIDVTH